MGFATSRIFTFFDRLTWLPVELGPECAGEFIQRVWFLDVFSRTEPLGLRDAFGFRISTGNDRLLPGMVFDNAAVGLATIDTGCHDHVQDKDIRFLVLQVFDGGLTCLLYTSDAADE